MPRLEEVKGILREKAEEKDGVFSYLPRLSDFTRQEIEFHDRIQADEEEIHQLNSLRNRYYHDYFRKYLLRLPADSVMLEIGSGSGFDCLPLIEAGKQVIVSDISFDSIRGIKEKIGLRGNVVYLVADGEQLPLADNSVDALFLAASLHHFPSAERILGEIRRVVKKGGLVIFAMEPSRFMMRFTRLFASNKSLRIHEGRSEADETHPGYNSADWKRIVSGFEVIELKRAWLTLGLLHYCLEGIYRLLRLKKRIRMPRVIEWILLVLDEILLKIPLINMINWHWIVVLTK